MQCADLSTQCEQAGPERQRELLIEAWHIVRPKPHPNTDAYTQWYYDGQTFEALLDIGIDEACTAAAMMLVDPAYRVRVDRMEDGRGAARVWLPGDIPESFGLLCATPALALLSAILKAKEQEDG